MGEAYLTSLSGARRLLLHFCEVGLRNNFDFEIAERKKSYPNAGRLALGRSHALWLTIKGGQGHIKTTGHFLNASLLQTESAGWGPPRWCAGDAWDQIPFSAPRDAGEMPPELQAITLQPFQHYGQALV